ncbi:hypothetical protein FACS189444_1440 [Spirochaetia bacterium]|nr:hypothetical protein FACS189444_1440 [Spirochaetia bacterium]
MREERDETLREARRELKLSSNDRSAQLLWQFAGPTWRYVELLLQEQNSKRGKVVYHISHLPPTKMVPQDPFFVSTNPFFCEDFFRFKFFQLKETGVRDSWLYTYCFKKELDFFNSSSTKDMDILRKYCEEEGYEDLFEDFEKKNTDHERWWQLMEGRKWVKKVIKEIGYDGFTTFGNV